ncbi:hypothetical protein Taro_054671 [Colocasia esculenta]|uniref:Uncharacterized protein n=1 Tax=Colocasia esculenta TaxID=4460 RepID=A0A843XP46_COLES|nr:hypothetical protein [Colocasia esculenta]
MHIKRRVNDDSNSCTTFTIGVGSQVLGYNQLIGHVGIHGQRRLTEALNKDSLVRQKEYPMESSSKSRENVYIEPSARHSRGILEQWSVGNGIPKTMQENEDKSI